MKKLIMAVLAIGILVAAFFLISPPLNRNGQSDLPDPTENSTEIPPEETPEPVFYDGVQVDENTKSIALNPESSVEELAALAENLTGLELIDFGAREPSVEELSLLNEAFPEVALQYSVAVNGQTYDCGVTELDFSAMSPADVDLAAEQIKKLPALSYVYLGGESESAGALGFTEVGKFQSARPDVSYDFSFTIYDKTFSTADEIIDLNHTWLGDAGEAVKAVLPYMNKCTYLDMDTCGLSNEQMEEIRNAFPNIKVVWRINFGSQYSVRTDVEKILASVKGEWLTAENVAPLKYCTDVKYLDLGHNIIGDISFVASMPDLEVAVLAINYWSDATPLASCKKLEYLEVFNTFLSDLSPLAELTNLKHLNICWLENVTDITPLYGLTNLERLWIGSMTPIPQDQIDTIREKLPNCVINTTTENPTEEGWRDDERYELLKEQFGYDEGAYSFYYLDPKYYPQS